jgi:hypothetical protein
MTSSSNYQRRAKAVVPRVTQHCHLDLYEAVSVLLVDVERIGLMI